MFNLNRLWLKIILLCFFLVVIRFSEIKAQIPINILTLGNNIVEAGGNNYYNSTSHSSSINTVIPSQNYQLNFNNTGNISIIDFTIGSDNFYNFVTFDTIIIRRASNAYVPTNGNKQHVFIEGPLALDNTTYNTNFTAFFPFTSSQNYMEKVLKKGYINCGSDNVFNNDGSSDLTFSNIERIDYVFKYGVNAADVNNIGFVVTDRGGNDAFKIAPILAIDANGNPTLFGTVKTVAASAYGTSGPSVNTYILRKDIGDTELRLFSKVPTQTVKSVFLSFSSLGILNNQQVYGYALMAPDVTATTSANLLNFTNGSFFPTNTTNATGGLDITGSIGIFMSNVVLANNSLTLSHKIENAQIKLNIENNDWQNTKEYELEKSNNGTDFYFLSKSAVFQNVEKMIDANPLPIGYYRVKCIKNNGSVYYSSILKITYKVSKTKISIFPNPIQNLLSINSQERLISKVSIFSQKGNLVKEINLNIKTSVVNTSLEKLTPGLYIVTVMDDWGTISSYNIIKE